MADATLVERDAPLDELRTYLADARAGSGRFVLVRGETGIGKTALVEAFVDSVRDEIPVLAGICDGVSTPKPFGPLHDLGDRLGSELIALLDEHAGRHAVSAWLIDRLSASGQAVLVIEDLHWADEATTELLTFLARRMDGMALLVVATIRDDDPATPPVRRLLGQLAGMTAVRHLVLQPLSPDGVAGMAAGTQTDPDDLYRLTSGNPFFVSQVLAAGNHRVPVSIGDALRARLDRLSARARSALEAAAVIGSRSEPWLLAAVAGEDVLGADECVAAGLLGTPTDVITFRHELTRLAVLDELPVFRAIGLHRRTLDALQRSGSGDDARLAHHAEGAGHGEEVLRHAVAAADTAMRVGANHEGVAQLRRAARFLDNADDPLRAQVLERLASALYSVNRLPEAFEVRQQALEVRVRLGDTLRIAENELALGKLTFWRGEGAAGRERINRAREMLEPLGDSAQLAMAYASVGGLEVGRETTLARDWTQRALEMGRRLEDPEVIAASLNTLGSMAMMEGDMSGEELLLESLRVSKEHSQFERAHAALFNLVILFAQNREPARASEYLAELIDYVSGVQIERCNLDCTLARLQLDMGSWTEAERSAQLALEYARTPSDDQGLALTTLATLAIRRGAEGWRALLDRAEQIVAGFDDFEFLVPVIRARAEAAWLDGTLSSLQPRLREGV
ncbi:MAG TPA: AAA family ATPase, partial [Candidatus Limnocylindria bacterium]|nr:AAA family ATPase [Candidatus Limnocylindria bacterium]